MKEVTSLRSVQRCLLFVLITAGSLTVVPDADAIPLYARRHELNCNACHQIVPTLNQFGLEYWNRGYRLPPEMEDPDHDTTPFAAWYTWRHEDQTSKGFGEGFLPKVELITGGPIGEQLSYFVEWRIISQETRGDGTLRDRSGRFEDAFINWQPDNVHTVTVGQYRALNQVDVSRRVSIDEPILFSAGLSGDAAPGDPRLTSLRGFSPSGRSPGVTYSLQLMQNDYSASDGLFFFGTVPFVGELSVPLTTEAHTEASFELHGEAKGVFLETFYRQGLSSIGMHAFVDNGRYLMTGVGVYNYENLFVTAGVGVDDGIGRDRRIRASGEFEYLLARDEDDLFRPGVGFRIEDISDSEPRYIPYFIISGPNQDHTFFAQLQYRIQEDNNAFFLDISAVH
ncbi:MAG: hypothetical protein WD049_08435 [Candidatus Paceibacterota bacterium]